MFMEDVKPLQIILFLLGFGAILFLTYVTTRYIAGKTGRALKGRNIQIIETVSLGLDKRIHLVKAGNRYILISSTSKHIGFLSEVGMDEEEERKPEAAGQQNVFNFKELFDKYTSVYLKRNEKQAGKEEPPGGGTSGPNFRTNLGRLKTLIRNTDQVEKNRDDNTNEK